MYLLDTPLFLVAIFKSGLLSFFTDEVTEVGKLLFLIEWCAWQIEYPAKSIHYDSVESWICYYKHFIFIAGLMRVNETMKSYIHT